MALEFFKIVFFQFFCSQALTENIEILPCSKPDFPVRGGYGPMASRYYPGDRIHYFCDVDTFIGGNYLRICQDNGRWTGDTPVCDGSERFFNVTQSSVMDDADYNAADMANDGLRSSCTSTKEEEQGATWTGFLRKASHVMRVMLFLPLGHEGYKVISIRRDGAEFSCGELQGYTERMEWLFHNCLSPNNTNIIGIKIKSLSSAPLRLCEVVVHALTDPTCVDPKVEVLNGQFALTRKEASLFCDEGYTRSPDYKLQCVRTGVWNRKKLFCTDEEDLIDINPRRNRL